MQPLSSSGLPSLKLDLGYEWSRDVKKELIESEEESNCGFTEAQWNELYLQAVIFKYIQYGRPIPLHLFLPFWKSVSSSFSSESDTTQFFRVFPTYRQLNSWGQPGDMSMMMDPEPGRCRRTDGKKWRCRKSIVPHQKYCERHVHRGRNRSRKLVEAKASQTKSESEINPATKYDRNPINMPLNLEPKFVPSSATNSVSPAADKTSIASPFATLEANRFFTNNSKDNSISVHGVGANLVSAIPPADCGGSIRGRSDIIDGKYSKLNSIYAAKETNQMIKERNSCQPYVFIPELGLSPKSGLEHGTGSTSSGISQNRMAESELMIRCRRSDGKKWQCKRASVPEQKYCEMHLHRGSKKITTSTSNPVTVALPPPSMDEIAIARDIDEGANLNTNLSIAPASHQFNCDSSAHTSGSDSTTITDETPTLVMH